MLDQYSFSDIEARLLLHLLEEARRDLPSEIRRTANPEFHDQLQDRLKVVDGLIEKLRHAPVH